MIGKTQATVLELQHSSIFDDERVVREAFYPCERRMFWLLCMHDDKSFRAYNFAFCFETNPRTAMVGTTKFEILKWSDLDSQFVENGNAQVFTSSSISTEPSTIWRLPWPAVTSCDHLTRSSSL